MTTPFETTVPFINSLTKYTCTVNWGVPAPAVNSLGYAFLYYNISVRDSITGVYKYYSNSDILGSSQGVTGLNPGSLYYIGVYALYANLSGEGDPAPGLPINVTTLPGEVTNIVNDTGSTYARLNWTAGAGAKNFVLTEDPAHVGGFPPGPAFPIPVSGAQTFNWATGLTSSTTYYGIIKSTADDLNFTTGVAFSFTTTVSGTTSIVQTASTTTTVSVTITPNSSTQTVTCTAGSVSPSSIAGNAGPTQVSITGLSAGTAYTVTSSGGVTTTQAVLTQPPAPTITTVNSPDSSTAVLNFSNPQTAGTPYLQVTAVPDIGVQYFAGTSPATVTGLTAGVAYAFSLLFGQDDIGGSEGAVTSAAMRSAVITSVNGSTFYYTTIGSLSTPTLQISATNFGSVIVSQDLTGDPSPYTLTKVQKALLTSGTTYYARITASTGQVISTVFPFEAHTSGFSATWFFSP